MIDFEKLAEESARRDLVRRTEAPADFLPTPAGWSVLDSVRGEGWFRELADWLPRERERADVLPAPGLELEALRLCPLERVRVVLLFQDPYPHGAACGVAASVPPGVPVPPTARMLREDLEAEGFGSDAVGFDLRPWAEAGALLLNATLTTVRGRPGAHANRGWEEYTRAVMRAVLDRDRRRWSEYHARRSGCFYGENTASLDPVCERHGTRVSACGGPPPVPAVFVALGGWARGQLGAVGGLCLPSDVLVTAPHPAARGGTFRGSRPFSRADARLRDLGTAEGFPWRLPGPRDVLSSGLRDARRLPPAEGRAALERAVSRALEQGFGLDPGPAPARPSPGERASASDRADLRAVQSALAKLSDADAALRDAARLLPPPAGNVSQTVEKETP